MALDFNLLQINCFRSFRINITKTYDFYRIYPLGAKGSKSCLNLILGAGY